MALTCCLDVTWSLAASAQAFSYKVSMIRVSHVLAHRVNTRKDLWRVVKFQHLLSPFPFVVNFNIAGGLSLHALVS